MEVGEIDPRDETAFDEWFAVLRATEVERWPDKPGWQRAERLAMALDQSGPEEHRCLAAREAGGDVVGIADLEMYRRENLHLARMDLRVLPGSRRRGVGRALVQAAARRAVEAGRSELGGMDETPVRPGFEDAAAPFARHFGFADTQHMVRRELVVPLSASQVDALQCHPKATAPGYAMLTFADRWPDEFIDDRCELGRRMSTDVPMGEQQLDEERWDEERVRQIEANFVAQDRAKISTAALHGASGRLVAYTEVAIPRGAPESAWQHDTLVMHEHRGHGLGFAMKVVNTLAVQSAHPGVRRISTWNAAENQPMIAVNDEMGHVVAANSVYWLKKLDGLSA